MSNDNGDLLRQRRHQHHVTTSTEIKKENKDDLIGFDQTKLSKSCSPSFLFRNPENQDHLQSTLKNNPLSGMTFFKLCRLLFWEKRRSIDWFRYKKRISCLILVSIFNSCLATIEWIYIKLYLSSVLNEVTPLNKESSTTHKPTEAPIFVLGHPRTGTTLLHSLLALDADRFTTCSTFCAGFPHAFLSFERLGKILFSSVLSDRRPMDNMKLHFDLPQEDELATCLLTGGMYSPYMSLYFVRDEHEYRQYQTFQNAPPEHVQQWTKAFKWLCTKLQIRDLIKQQQQQKQKQKEDHTQVNDISKLQPRRLLLKSPCHTGRVRHLLSLYPNAQFVYIHRHPLEVFLSGVHMANTTYGYMFLQQPRDGDLKEYILRQGEILIEEYVDSVEQLQQEGQLQIGKNFIEVSFDELTNNPYQTIEAIYNGLDGLNNVFSSAPSSSPSSSFPTDLKAYCESLKGYRRNKFNADLIDDQLHREIKSRWKIQYERFDYS